MFLESTVIVLLLTPILVPVITKVGIDPVHFGLVMMTTVTLGGMTPPVGVAMYTVCGMLNCSMDEYTREAIPLLGAVLVLVGDPDLLPVAGAGVAATDLLARSRRYPQSVVRPPSHLIALPSSA